MFDWIAGIGRKRRATTYLAAHPEDEPAVTAILLSIEAGFNYQSAREVAEMLKGKELSDSEWSKYGPRWERAWNDIVAGS